MSTGLLTGVILTFGVVAWFLGSWRANSCVAWNTAKLHSRPHYYSWFTIMWTVLPAMCVVLLWAMAEPALIETMVQSQLPEDVLAMPRPRRSLVLGMIDSIADGLRRATPAQLADIQSGTAHVRDVLASQGVPLASAPEPFMVTAAYQSNVLHKSSRIIAAVTGVLISILGLLFALSRIGPEHRARNAVERVMLLGLASASTVAIITTLGIVFSMLFETLHFFSMVEPSSFFLGTVWDPRFSPRGQVAAEGQFGLLPVLWGTLYISLVALLVAVPVGLFSAIYMSEYSTRSVRTASKPLLEVLAGIPTIVYGFFAIISFGPFLRDAGAQLGLSISATCVLTAGVIMGVMLIPFVSSLSDDIINAVPQSLRDGSYALGATQSETIKRVVLLAALPGLVGATLLAASRAIGETMIVVLAAGIAANLTLNPFEPVTTITVKIVSQLTGDLEFNSPQTLVAFALGLTLFVFTLALNIYALYMVRRYREQYE